jgi:hypothetical protein
LERKVADMHALKEDFEDQYLRLKNQMDNRYINEDEYGRRILELKSKENDKLRDLELLYSEKQNDLEEALTMELETKHSEELVDLKKQQYKQKQELMEKYIPADILANILEGEEELMDREISNYRDQLKKENDERMHELMDKKGRIQKIEELNANKMRELELQTKKLLEDQARREKQRMKKKKKDMEEEKQKREEEISKQSVDENEKNRLLEEYRANYDRLCGQMEAEKTRQGELMRSKLEEKIKEKEMLKRQKEHQLAIYKREQDDKLNKKVNQIQDSISEMYQTKMGFGARQNQDKFVVLNQKFNQEKNVFDKFKPLGGVEGILELQSIAPSAMLGLLNAQKKVNVKEGPVAVKLNFDVLLKKIGRLEELVDNFSADKFAQLMNGFRKLDGQLNKLKELPQQLPTKQES